MARESVQAPGFTFKEKEINKMATRQGNPDKGEVVHYYPNAGEYHHVKNNNVLCLNGAYNRFDTNDWNEVTCPACKRKGNK